jgi:hypothetical protein
LRAARLYAVILKGILVPVNEIGSIARQGIALIVNPNLRCELDAVYRSPLGIETVETAHGVFNRLTSSEWPLETLCRFFSGWRSTHGTALFVSGLIIRVLREACKTSEFSRRLLYRSAAEIAEIITEDTGVDDIPHEELFTRFANHIVGDDRWQLSRYAVPACERFRSYIKRQRLAAPIEQAILTTMASENWNTGEYTYFDTLVRSWMLDVIGRSSDDVEEKVAYVKVHSGETELGHFLHALSAWEFYCQASAHEPDPIKARHALELYLEGVRTAFSALDQLFEG